MGAELGTRARAFKLGLQKLAHDHSEDFAAMFGADPEVAAELCALLGLDEHQAQTIVDFALERSGLVTRFWLDRIDSLLDTYATGAWWTDEMREAWERLQEAGS